MRWTPRRKEKVLSEIRAGMSTYEAIEKYELSKEELDSWINNHAKIGRRGLYSNFVHAMKSRQNVPAK